MNYRTMYHGSILGCGIATKYREGDKDLGIYADNQLIAEVPAGTKRKRILAIAAEIVPDLIAARQAKREQIEKAPPAGREKSKTHNGVNIE